MNKKYIVVFNLKGNMPPIEVEVMAENSELALNQGQGMLHSNTYGWINLNDIHGQSLRVRPDLIKVISCYPLEVSHEQR